MTTEPRFSLALSTSELLIAEVHSAIRKLGGTAEPATPDEVWQVLCALGADTDLRSVVASWWGQTIDDKQALKMLRDWNAGRPVFREAPARPRRSRKRRIE